jgi:hypothetical protein
LKTFQQPPKESFGGFDIPSWLDEDVEHDAVLIHLAPKIMLYALDPDEHLVQVPFVAGPKSASAQTIGKDLAELFAPTPHRLIGDDNAPFSQKQLDISQAEAEHVIRPDSMADDLNGKAMAIA